MQAKIFLNLGAKNKINEMKFFEKIFFVVVIYGLIVFELYVYNNIDFSSFSGRFDHIKLDLIYKNKPFTFVEPDLGSAEANRKYREDNLLKSLDIRLEENTNDKLNEYVKFFNESINDSKKGTKKVMFCDPRHGGFGNRVYTFFSCFLVGIITDSLVILTAWHETREFIDLPFNPFYETKENNDLNPQFEKEKIHGFGVPYAWNARKDLNSLMTFQIPKDRTRYHYGAYHCLYMVFCTNPDHYDKLIYYNLVKKETVQKSIETMKNKSSTYEEKSHNLFMIGFEVGANLLNKIVIPKPRIQDIINDFVKHHFLDNFVIGIQLRTIYLDVEKDSLRFINCAFQIENEYLRAYKEKAKPVKWFISSDSEDLLKKVVATYPEKALVGNGTIKHVSFDSIGYERTLIDIDLLSKCDELIHTGGSTFGFVAAMKGFKVPYYVDGRKNESKCFRTSLGTTSVTSNGDYVF